MKEEIVEIIKMAVEELNEQLEDDKKFVYNESDQLIGSESMLDSMSFVTLITIIEELLEEKYDRVVEIVSDKAFSQEKSPFLSFATLAEYIYGLMEGLAS